MQDSYKTTVNYFQEYKLNFLVNFSSTVLKLVMAVVNFTFCLGIERHSFSVLSGISVNYLLIKCMMCYGRH